MSQRSHRKEEHLALAQKLFNPSKKNSFDEMFLLRPALPESKVDISLLQTTAFNKKLSAPFFIEAMTGGSAASLTINKSLAKAAYQNQIGMALGSSSILEKEKTQLASFAVARQENPDGLIIANINPNTSPSAARLITEDLKADALQIHLNAIQEAVMPEGDRDFRWLEQLQNIRQAVTVPIIIKEVGFGLDQATIKKLKAEGFNCFDLGGSGGTNFVQIENKRGASDLSYLENAGLSTVISAVMALKEKATFLVSGGVRNPLDILKSLVLGGKLAGIAGVFLHCLQTKGETELNQEIAHFKQQLALLFAIYGISNIAECPQLDFSFSLELKNQIEQLVK